MFRKIAYLIALVILGAIVVYEPLTTSVAGPNPNDPAHEDLSRVDYPSLAKIPWRPHFMRPEESLESLFGDDWPYIARFNRIDRRHVYPGMTIKVPVRIADARTYCPLPEEYPPAERYEKFILIDLTEQWIGAYEYGELVFSGPAATGAAGHETPVGLYQIDARDKTHSSSLYKTEDQTDQYPMDNAMRFHVGADNVSYWIHARDLPGKPASHGCVGTYDEAMQNRVYGSPQVPVLLDSERLYSWAVGEEEFEDDPEELEEIEGAPMVEVRGAIPQFKQVVATR